MRQSYHRVRGAAVAVVALSVATVLATVAAVGAVTPGTVTQVKNLVAASIHITKADSAVMTEVAHASSDTWAVQFHIPPNTSCLTATACVYGDKTGTNVIVLYGDSHARMWMPALNTIANTAKARLVVLGQDGCPVAEVALSKSTSYAKSCPTVQFDVVGVIDKLHPETTILANSTFDTGFTAAQWQAGMEATFKSLAAAKSKIVLMQDANEFTIAPPTCISQHPSTIQTSCAVANPNHLMPLRSTAEQAAAKAKYIPYILTNPWLCTSTRCSPVVGDFVTHFDRGHITASYATYLTTVLATAIKPFIKSY